jgi:hypothetical protein
MYCHLQVKAGDALTLTYGPHSNQELLLSYGFILPVNRNDSFDWDFDVETMAVGEHGVGFDCKYTALTA